MIPVRLQLRNFLCYRDNVPALDFAGIHVACLSGSNGHGKSALLDAITWALWGKARARQDDQMVHMGETDMEVEFDFLLEGRLYKVIRKRSKKGRGQSALELQVQDGEGFRVLTEPSMRASQDRINQILRMDYDTFINSAFLLQGRADEFTVKSPAERKQVLSDILGLALYDRAEEIAKQRVRECNEDLGELTAQVREIDRELVNLPTYQAEEKRHLVEAERLEADCERARRDLEEVQGRLTGLQLEARELEVLQRTMSQDEQRLSQRQEQRRVVAGRIREIEALLGRADEIEKGHAQLLRAREEEASMGKRAARAHELRGEIMRLENGIAQARQQIALELQQFQGQEEELQEQVAKAPTLRAKLEETAKSLAALDVAEAERENLRQSVQQIDLEGERLKSENQRLLREMKDLKAKIDELSAASAECPLCRSPLSDENRERLLQEMTSEGRDKKAAFEANKERLQTLEAERSSHAERIAALDAQLRLRPQVQRQEVALSGAIEQAERAAQTLAELQGKIAAAKERLESDAYARPERQRLAMVSAELQKLGYDSARHEALRGQIETLSNLEAQYLELANARKRIEIERAEIQRLDEEISALETSVQSGDARAAALRAALAALPELEASYANRQAALDGLLRDERSARDRLAATRQKLDFCERLGEQRADKDATLKRLAEEKAAYEDLRLAFGKKGIQAMIIESVIPEIQDEANAMLRRMTDGKMTVELQTQRDTKSGSTLETLDIQISDELGARPYELFSGGEAFRVNFAIRIALSKLLARRAGAQLRTLIIDEGFGSQDASGRQKLVDAIQSIQDDFEKILVITHVEELRDAFPVRIHVEKASEGSTYTIM